MDKDIESGFILTLAQFASLPAMTTCRVLLTDVPLVTDFLGDHFKHKHNHLPLNCCYQCGEHAPSLLCGTDILYLLTVFSRPGFRVFRGKILASQCQKYQPRIFAQTTRTKVTLSTWKMVLA